MSQEEPKWKYDAGEPWARKKHGWEHAHAGFRLVRFGKRKTMPVGMCPSTVRTKERAQALLNELGFPYEDSDDEVEPLLPSRIYGVYQGVPYETRKSGDTFHAFPIIPERWPKIPEYVRECIVTAMNAAGATLDSWLTREAE